MTCHDCEIGDRPSTLRALECVFEAAPLAIVTLDANRKVETWNRAAEQVFGWSREEVIGSDAPWVPEESRAEFEELYRQVIEGAGFSGIEIRRRRRDGQMIDLSVIATRLTGSDRNAAGVLVFLHDITNEKAARDAEARQLRFHQQLLDGIPVPIFFKDPELRYQKCNTAFEELIGYPRHEIIGKTVFDLSPVHRALIYDEADRELLDLGTIQVYESSVAKEDGSIRHVVFNKAILRSPTGAIDGIVGTILDITERKRAEQKLVYQAYHDALTGLPNQLLFKERLEQGLFQSRRNDQMLAVAVVDLDRFKVINDTLGHDVGDRLLKVASDRLQSCLRESDTVARLGGDEFTVLLGGLSDGRAVARACERILAALAEPVEIDGRTVVTSASVGISLYPHDGDEPGLLLQRADSAMSRAKDAGRNCYRLYSAEMDEAIHSRLELEASMRQALDRGEFSIVYQPQVRLGDRSIVGFEALLRWNHPVLGNVSPLEFIPIAEESGLIGPLGAWVLQQACAQGAAWIADGHPSRRIAVNVSAKQLERGDFVRQVSEALWEAGFPAELLELEVTESSVMRDANCAADQLAQLRELGVRISIDDFGTGFSSLSRLQSLPLDQLKIDRAFIRDMEAEKSTLPLAQGIVTLAHALGLQVVAEGVETEKQAELLTALGCEQAQGWFFGRPARPEDLAKIITAA